MGCSRPGLSLVAIANTRSREQMEEKRQPTDRETRESLDRQPSLNARTCMIFIGLGPEIASRSQRQRVQYEPNINHISKNNIPAAPLPSALSPFSLSIIAASPGVCSIKHSPSEGCWNVPRQGQEQERGVSFANNAKCTAFCVNKDNEAG